MSNKKRKTTWTSLLLKRECNEQSAIRASVRSISKQYKVVDEGKYIGTLIVGPKKRKPPKWVSRVKPHVQGLPDLTNETVSAVLLIPVSGRLFAMTFGYGRSLLEQDCWEDGFGLKVTLNAVPPGNFRAIDRSSFDAF